MREDVWQNAHTVPSCLCNSDCYTALRKYLRPPIKDAGKSGPFSYLEKKHGWSA